MAYVPNSGSVVAFQSNPSSLLVGASVIGLTPVAVSNFPTNQNISGSVVATQGTTPWVVSSGNASIITVSQGSIAVNIIAGSIAASFTPPANQSVSGTVGASIIGLPPVNVVGTPSISGTVLIGNANVNVSGSVAAWLQSTNASVITVGTAAPNQSVSGTVGASIIGQLPAGTAVLGSVAALQGTNPWTVVSSIAGGIFPISGSVAATITNTNLNVSGSVVAFQGGVPWVHTNVGSLITVSQGSVAVAIISGSIAASFTPPANQSVSGTVNIGTGGPVSVMGTMSVLGTVPVTQSGVWNTSSLISIPAIISTANSTTSPVTSTLSFTGTGEEWKDFGSIVINVFTDAVSATDGLSIQQSSDNSNWDIRDAYTVPSMAAGGGKTFQVQPAARYGRIVYTQGAQNSGAFRLQTVYHPQMVKPSSQRPQDGYSNETDLEQVQGFNMVFNGSTWDRQRGTTAGAAIYGSVVAVLTSPSIVAVQGGTAVTSLVSTVPSSVIVGASIFGQLPGGTAVLGSVAALQGTNPWIVVSSIAGGIFPISGSVAATVTNTNLNVSGSVVAFQAGTQITSISGVAYAEDAPHATGDPGLFVLGVRNDAVASFVSANLDYSPIGVDSAGRSLIKPFAAEESRIEGYASLVSTSVTTLVAAAGAGLKNYITDVLVANTGATTTLITFRSQGGTSVLGYTIAPSGGGSNIPGMAVPFRTGANESFDFQPTSASSILYVTVKGFKAP